MKVSVRCICKLFFSVSFLVVFCLFVGILAFLVHINMRKMTTYILLLIYVLAVISVTLLFRDFDIGTRIRLNPIRFYSKFSQNAIEKTRENGWHGLWVTICKYEFSIIEILLNILLFVPLGLLIPQAFECFRRWWRILLVGISLSALIEILQYISRQGCLDTSDILHNTIGICMGFLIWNKLTKRNNDHKNCGESK